MSTTNELGKLIRMHRKQLGMTPKELGLRTGYTANTIRSMEADKRYNLTAKAVNAIADALGLRVVVLFKPKETA